MLNFQYFIALELLKAFNFFTISFQIFNPSFWDCKGRNFFLFRKLYFFNFLSAFLTPLFNLSRLSLAGCKGIIPSPLSKLYFKILKALFQCASCIFVTSFAGCKGVYNFSVCQVKISLLLNYLQPIESSKNNALSI